MIYGASAREQSLWLLLRADETVTVDYQIPDHLEAPVTEGQQVGCVVYRLQDEVLKEYPVYASRSIGERNFAWCLRKVEEKYRQ